MIVASLPEIGGSFILPARAAAKIRDDIMICGEPIYSWFGLLAKDVPDPANGTKVVVEFVAENAPAKKGGIYGWRRNYRDKFPKGIKQHRVAPHRHSSYARRKRRSLKC